MDPKERGLLARAYFRKGYNCCQSVLLAFKDEAGLSEEDIARLASGFGGGMGRLREVCGAMSAMTFMSGVIRPAVHPGILEERADNYALVQDFAGTFRKEFGSIVCRDILRIRADRKESPVPSVRDEQWYTIRPCERIIGFAAEEIARKMSAIAPEK